MLSTIEHLGEIVRRCREGQPLTEELSEWLANGLAKFLAHNVNSIDEALGVCTMRGGMPWWREVANRQRDNALRELTARHFAHLSMTASAERIVCLANRYASSAWRFDRDRTEMPVAYRGSPTEHLWIAFKSGAPMPIGERQLRTILNSGRRQALPATDPAARELLTAQSLDAVGGAV